MEKNCLIIFVKNPSFGKVKTRLAADIGDAAAMAVYIKLLNKTMEICSSVKANRVVYYSEFIDTEDEWSNDLFEKGSQKGSDLGERMMNAFSDQFEKGFERVCIVGSDIPELSEEIITTAFNDLQNVDCVIGPSFDGGYYLLGLKSLFPSLFQKKSWGSNSVLESTISNLDELNVKYSQLITLLDIDTKEDLLKAWPDFQWI